eukprot:674899-Prymnesium_polylepis.1
MIPACQLVFISARGTRKVTRIRVPQTPRTRGIRVPHTPDAVGRVASLRQGRGFVQLGIPSAFVCASVRIIIFDFRRARRSRAG